MNVYIPKEKLTDAVLRAGKMTGRNLSLPVLRALLLVADSGEGVLKIRATNLDIGIELVIPTRVESDGVAAIPADVLGGLLTASYRGDTVHIRTVGENISVEVGGNTTTIKTLPHDEFPILPTISSGDAVRLSAHKVAEGLRAVSYAGSNTTLRQEIASVYLYGDGTHIVCVATDSFRLAEKKIQTEQPVEMSGILIPIKNVSEIVRNLESYDGDVDITYTEHQAVFGTDDFFITTRIIDGSFPDYKQIIPKEHTTEAVMLKQDVIQALKAANVFANSYGQVRMIVNPKDKEFRFETSNQDIGENSVVVDAALSGDEVNISFNYRYVSDVFQSLGTSDSVVFKWSGSGKPLVVRGIHDALFTYLVMPMNR